MVRKLKFIFKFIFLLISPCLIANLWDVTDCDIDRFSLELIENFKDEENELSLIECIPLAREKCKLKYLIGCAPVCYGIPVFKK